VKTVLHIELDLAGDRADAAARVDALIAALTATAPGLGARIEATHVDRLRPVTAGGAR
jgi:hypothetical protein